MIIIIIIKNKRGRSLALYSFFFYVIPNERCSIKKKLDNPDQEFSDAAYHTVMFLVDHFRTIKEELKIDYESFYNPASCKQSLAI